MSDSSIHSRFRTVSDSGTYETYDMHEETGNHYTRTLQHGHNQQRLPNAPALPLGHAVEMFQFS